VMRCGLIMVSGRSVGDLKYVTLEKLVSIDDRGQTDRATKLGFATVAVLGRATPHASQC